MNITTAQLAMLHHALGVDPRKRTPYRNHYVAGPGHYAQPDLEVLESAGLMQRGRTPGFCDPGDVIYHCTDKGKSFALDNLAQPPKRSRYEQFLDDDYGHSFAEWLGIEVPKLECGDYWYETKGQVRYKSSRAIGAWAATQKQAKANYKEALKARKAEARAWA